MTKPLDSLMPGRYTAEGFESYGVRSAEVARDNAYPTHYGTADYNTRYDRERLVAVSRALEVNNWLYETIFNRWSDYILGPTGFTLQAKTSDPNINARIEDEIWPAFADDPEATGQMTWRDCEEVNLRDIGVAGDQLWLKLGPGAGPAAGRLQHVESERITSSTGAFVKAFDDGSRIEQGVRLDRLGRPVGFFVADVADLGYVNPASAREIPARDCLFVGGRRRRSSSTRFLPVMTASMPNLYRADDILTSEAVAWQVLSRLVFTLKRGSHAVRPTFADGKNSAATDNASAGSTRDTARLVTDIGMALLFEARKDDQIEPVTQNRPNAKLEDSMRFLIRVAGAPLGIPLEILLLDWGQTNYSSARAVLLQAFISFRLWQRHLVTRFYTRVYRWQIGRAIARGVLPWRPDILDHIWNVPGWPWIDEDNEVSAWAKKLDRSIATQTQAMASLSLDLDEQRAERQKEVMAAWKTAVEIEESTGGRIQATDLWRHFAGLQTGLTESAVRAKESAPENQPKRSTPSASPEAPQ